MNKVLSFFIFITLSISCYSQKHDYNWLWGYGPVTPGWQGGSKFDFNFVPPRVSLDLRRTDLNSYNAMISDKNGRLAFFTNGLWVADRLGNKMLWGDSLNYANGQAWNHYRVSWGAVSESRQEAIILPKPSVDSIYYLFHKNIYLRTNIGPTNGDSIHLCYSIIDMSLNNGLGAVVEKNRTLVGGANFVYNPTACKHANGRDWWVVFRDVDLSFVHIFLLTANGIEQLRKVRIDPSLPSWRRHRTYSALFSPDGSKYAFYDIQNGIRIYDFDRCDGSFTPYKSFTAMDTVQYSGSLTFSPNIRFMYLFQYHSIVQFDIQAPVLRQDTLVRWDGASFPNNPEQGFDMAQLMPDGKIYGPAAVQGYHIHVINAPDSAGLACRAVQRQITTPTWNNSTLPHYPNYRLGPLRGSGCDTLVSGVVTSPTPPEEGLRLFPNPSKGYQMFTSDKPLTEDAQLIYYDLLGKPQATFMLSKGSSILDIDIQLASGVYYVRLENSRESLLLGKSVIVND